MIRGGNVIFEKNLHNTKKRRLLSLQFLYLFMFDSSPTLFLFHK
jgi:hypothetical protein